jgi:sarcosine oxidase
VSQQRDFIVVGAGLLGLSAARALVRRGREVTVLEQAEIGHAGGGSHGNCRIFRLGYRDPGYVSMARRARELWQAAEAESGAQFLYPAPHLSFGDGLEAVHAAMLSAGAPCELLPPAVAAARFPALSHDGPALLEPGSCVIAADLVLRTLAAGCPEIMTGVRVSALRDDGRQVTVSTDAGQFTAAVVIVTAGPWTSGLLGPAGVHVPACPTLEQVGYLTPAGAGQAAAAADAAADAEMAAPIFICHGAQSPYGLPVPGSSLYKIGVHQSGLPVDPDDQDQSLGGAGSLRLTWLARRHLPGMNPEPIRIERCIYDNSPDEDFVVDRAGNIVVGSGTSGHGFKFGPLFGDWLAGLAAGDPQATPPARFALRRLR